MRSLVLVAVIALAACGARAGSTTHTTHTYRGAMIAADLAVLAIGAGAIAATDPDDTDLDPAFIAVAAASTVVGPATHAAHGNRPAAAYSALRRLVIPLTVIGVLRAGVRCGDDHGECASERSVLTRVGWLYSAPIAIAWDVVRAKVDVPIDVAPSVSASAEHAVFGVGGQF